MSRDEAKDYLEKNLREIMQPLVNSVMINKPIDPVQFMIQWLQDYSGAKIKEDPERKELEKLRKKIEKYKKKYPDVDKEMEISSEEEEDVSAEEQNKVDELIMQRQQMNAQKRGRTSISAEAYGFFNKKEDYKPRVIPKTEEQKSRIISKCMQSFIFNSLEDKELDAVVNAFEERKYNSGDIVIQQGDEGDVIFLVDTGELDCEKTFNPSEGPKYLKTYKPGESFGELALLYNVPRAATIKAKTDCICWALDRLCFNHIVKDAAIKKREKYEATLKKVEILSTIDPYEIGQISDALKTEKVNAGTLIIKQGDPGDKFYILDEGKAYASKVITEGKGEEKVKEYTSGGFFGELALLNNQPRAANIYSETECKLLTLDRLAFKRLLGPLENLLQRNSETYTKYIRNE